ncbi:MAG: hypothetical protein NPIRA02_03050 [Nitrospirales bacterium]|nr:MAG: hypothetical protein NPIRA02_03050 [Nitrospirales bacterium]
MTNIININDNPEILSDYKGLNLFDSNEWIKTLLHTFSYQIYAIQQDRGMIFFAFIDDFIGKRIVSLPFSDYVKSGLNIDQLEDIIKTIERNFKDCPIKFRWDGESFKDCTIRNLTTNIVAQYHRVDIDDEDVMLKNTSNSFRRAVAKAKKNGVSIHKSSDIESVRRFFRLFAQHRKLKFKILTPPITFFEVIFDEFFKAGNGFVLEAMLDGEVISAILLLKHKNVLYYKFGASKMEKLEYRSNNLLFWDLLCRARKDQYDIVDLGMSWCADDDIGVVRFKQSMGAISYPIAIISNTLLAEDNKREDARQVLRDITKLIIESDPDEELLHKAGNLLFRYFT